MTDSDWQVFLLFRVDGSDKVLRVQVSFTDETQDVESVIKYLHDNYPKSRGVPITAIFRGSVDT